jgi:hypothetical protein
MDDAIWADDLDSDDDIDGDELAGGDQRDKNVRGDDDTPKHSAAHGNRAEETGVSVETRFPSYAAGSRQSEEELSDQDLDDSTSAVSDDPPTGRGRRTLRQESMTRCPERNRPSYSPQNARLILFPRVRLYILQNN